MSQLRDYQQAVLEVNVANGWFDDERSFGDDMALLHSEVSEAFEAYRDWNVIDMTKNLCVQKFGKKAHDAMLDEGEHICKPEGVGSELADILVRLLDTCERYDIDLETEFERKLAYNKTRGYKHGGKIV